MKERRNPGRPAMGRLFLWSRDMGRNMRQLTASNRAGRFNSAGGYRRPGGYRAGDITRANSRSGS